MAGVSPFMTLEEIYDYLPNFDADCDLQVGDWVVVQPRRMAALLGPLITAWEGGTPLSLPTASSVSVPQYTLSQLLPEPLTLRRRSLEWRGASLDTVVANLPHLAPLSMARAHFCHRKRVHVSDDSPTNAGDSKMFGRDESSGNGALYLHVRLGLLTPSRPYLFGGLDIVEVLAWPSAFACAEEEAAAARAPIPSRLYLNLLTGETLTKAEAVRRTSKLVPAYGAAQTITWCSAIEEAAEQEWQQWLLRSKCVVAPQPCG